MFILFVYCIYLRIPICPHYSGESFLFPGVQQNTTYKSYKSELKSLVWVLFRCSCLPKSLVVHPLAAYKTLTAH